MERTESEGIAGVGHELLVGHYNPDGTDNVHGPRSHIGNCRRRFLLAAFHFIQSDRPTPIPKATSSPPFRRINKGEKEGWDPLQICESVTL